MAKYGKHELGMALMLAPDDFQHRLDAELAERGFPGIRRRHRAVFMHLGAHGPSRSVDLAAAAGIRSQSMMKIVHELEKLRLVSRTIDPRDSRAKLISLSQQGRKLLEQLNTSTQVVWGQYAQLLGVNQLETMLASLRLLVSPPHSERDKPVHR